MKISPEVIYETARSVIRALRNFGNLESSYFEKLGDSGFFGGGLNLRGQWKFTQGIESVIGKEAKYDPVASLTVNLYDHLVEDEYNGNEVSLNFVYASYYSKGKGIPHLERTKPFMVVQYKHAERGPYYDEKYRNVPFAAMALDLEEGNVAEVYVDKGQTKLKGLKELKGRQIAEREHVKDLLSTFFKLIYISRGVVPDYQI